MILQEIAVRNFDWLRSNPYPGRGIVIGQMKGKDDYVQIYWIMGRSGNSRNRIFVKDGSGFVRTEVFDKNQPYDPQLTIYFALKHAGPHHVVTNGRHTDAIIDVLNAGGSFERGLDAWQFESDPPNYTPRIAGVLEIVDQTGRYELSVLKSLTNDPRYSTKQYFRYPTPVPGIGHCITTYAGDGTPLPSFAGEPLPVPLEGDIERIANDYWNALNTDNKVALAVKTVNKNDHAFKIRIINKLGQIPKEIR
jgi:hypothetical protein